MPSNEIPEENFIVIFVEQSCSMQNVLNRLDENTVRVRCERGIEGLKDKFSGEILIIGGGPSGQTRLKEINEFSGKKLLCTARDPGINNLDFLMFGDTFTCRTQFNITEDTYLFSRGMITDLHGQFKINKERWHHWSTEFKWRSFTGPCAVQCGMYLGFETVYFVGMDGVGAPVQGYYHRSKMQIDELQRQFPEVIKML